MYVQSKSCISTMSMTLMTYSYTCKKLNWNTSHNNANKTNPKPTNHNLQMRCEDGDKVVKSKTKSLWDWD